MKNFKKFKEAVSIAKDIAIFCHINPDGDTIGSLLSLGLGLESLGKKIYFVSQDGVPRIYRILPRASRVQKKLKKKVDLAIAVDCGAKSLLGRSYLAFKSAKDTVEIDHHGSRESFARISLIDKNAAAVGEIIFKLLKDLNISFDKNIAQNILTSIIVETNSFRLEDCNHKCDR